jgi:peptidoglycan/xylan/chitin deacetylase (PgdA/CDA1 family)
MSQTLGAPLHIAGAWDIYPAGNWKWRLRRAAKQALFLTYLHCGWVPLRDAVLSMLGRSHIVILYYHRVGWLDLLSKPTGEFRAEVQYLARHYECLTMRQLIDRLADGQPITRKVAVITFDDGYRDNYLSAFPELKRAGVPATFFVSTGFVGTHNAFPHDTRAVARGQSTHDDWEKISWDELREMQQAGMEIGSHTVGHTNMGSADEATIQRELSESLQKLTQELGPGPRAFAFPWGKPADVSEAAIKSVRELGYYAAVTTSPGAVRRGDDLLQLRRVDVGNGQFTRLAIRATVEGIGCGWLARLLRQL